MKKQLYLIIVIMSLVLVACGKDEPKSVENQNKTVEQSISEKSKPAQEVEKLINAIGSVSINSGDAIKAAEDYYDTLTPNQKDEVENYKILVDARKAFDNLFFFAECPELKRPDGSMFNCPLIDEKDSEKSKTYVFSLGDSQIESVVLAKADEYIKAIEKDGFKVANGAAAGYYMVNYGDQFICTLGLNAIEGSGYCMLFVFSK